MAYPHQNTTPTPAQDDYTNSVTLLLSNGGGTLLDVDLFEWAIQWRWRRLHSNHNRPRSEPQYRAVRHGRKGETVTVYLAREIIKPGPGMVTDHVNRNSLDDRRRNLRVCTQYENCQNTSRMYRPHNKKASSKYKGVTFDKTHRKWKAAISIGKKQKTLGYFDHEDNAARAYDQMASLHHGEFAYLNGV